MFGVQSFFVVATDPLVQITRQNPEMFTRTDRRKTATTYQIVKIGRPEAEARCGFANC